MYQGHMNDGSSIQKHSAGPLYPFVVYETHDGRTHVMHPSGLTATVPGRVAAENLVRVAREYQTPDESLLSSFASFANVLGTSVTQL